MKLRLFAERDSNSKTPSEICKRGEYLCATFRTSFAVSPCNHGIRTPTCMGVLITPATMLIDVCVPMWLLGNSGTWNRVCFSKTKYGNWRGTGQLSWRLRKMTCGFHGNRSRGTENMEYVKNIIFHFMCSDSYGRQQMVSPIATVLHFSPDEVQYCPPPFPFPFSLSPLSVSLLPSLSLSLSSSLTPSLSPSHFLLPSLCNVACNVAC